MNETARHSPTFSQETGATLRLTLPLAGGMLSHTGMALTDTILLGGLGRDALAAGGLAVVIFATLTTVLHGFVASIGILVSHAQGARRPEDIPPILRAGFLLATLAALPLMAILAWIEPLLLLVDEPPALAKNVAAYDMILMLGVLPSLWMATQRSYLTALHRPRPVMVISLVALAINGFLNYGLMHGVWGLPALGYLGSATATMLVQWGMFAAATVAIGRDARHAAVRGLLDRKVIKELAHLGWPIAGTYAVEILLFTSGALMMGVLGPTALAAHQVAISVASTTFMVPLSAGQAANVRVGYHMGAQAPRAARQAGHAAFVLGVGFMAVMAAIMLTAPHQIARLFNLDPARATDAEVIAVVVKLLAISGAFQVVDGAQAIAAGALRGFKDTRMPMALAGFGYWGVGFPVAWILGFPMGLGAAGIWWGLAAGLAVTALALGWRFERLTKKLIRAAA
ncbi:MAG: MATE family efflux transporter [Rhodospirillaceae bacterium]|nr:MATE family efflux transporter [Rhodospirillaceae bacterium]